MAYAVDIQVDLRFLCLEDDADFEPPVRKSVERPRNKRRQYLPNFFRPKRHTGDPNPLLNFAGQTTDPKKLNAEGGGDNICAAVRWVPAQL